MKAAMIGLRFGRLTVIEEGVKYKNNCTWICSCDCGNVTKPIIGYSLRDGSTKSCGCLKKELILKRNKRHDGSQSRLYTVWNGMKNRCYSPNSSAFKNYGARGITVCDEWKNDFQAFFSWSMKNGYDPEAQRGKCTLDRIDNDGNYEPSNCRWATMKEQGNNRRSNVRVEINGRTQTLTQWSEETGIMFDTLKWRYTHGVRGVDLLRPIKTTVQEG